MPIPILKKRILICTKNVKFYFQGSSFKQIDGVAMGNPLGPTLADIFMAKLEQLADTDIQLLPLYKRYLDDILIISESKSQTENLLSLFNTLHPNIVFTCEYEHENKLPFLDVLIIRNADGTMSLFVDRKPTWIKQYLKFYRFSSLEHKRALVLSLAHRARQICTPGTLSEEME